MARHKERTTTRQLSAQASGNRIPPLALAFALIVLFSCFVFLPGVTDYPLLEWSILGTAGALLLLLLLVRWQVARAGRVLRYEFVPKPVHYVQLTMHTCIYTYWG